MSPLLKTKQGQGQNQNSQISRSFMSGDSTPMVSIRSLLTSCASSHKYIYIYKHTYTNIKHLIFEELVPSVLPVFKNNNNNIRLGHAGIVDHSVDLSIPYFKKSFKKKWTEAIKKKKNII